MSDDAAKTTENAATEAATPQQPTQEVGQIPTPAVQETAQEQALPDPETAAPVQEGGMFGITTETTHTNNIPIPSVMKLPQATAQYPNGYSFPMARLVNVVAKPDFEKKDKTTTSVLQFIFKDAKGRQFIHFEWEIDLADEAFAKKNTSSQSRIKHIFVEAFGEKAFPQEGIGTTAKTFGEFHTAVAEYFNKMQDKDGNKIYATGNFYLKLTYYKENLGFPLSPPFLQRFNPQSTACILAINPRWDKIEPQKSAASNLAGAAGSPVDPDALPSFENEYS